MLLYIIRHGEPVYNPNGLTQMGQEQAEAIAKRLSLHGIDKIYASPLKRARMTAEPLAKLLNKEVIIEEFMCEEKAGESFCVKDEKGEDKWMFLIEKYRREMQSKRILDLGDKWYNHQVFNTPKCKSGYERILNESDRFLSELGYVHDRENGWYKATAPNDLRVAAFCHGGFGLSWLGILLNIPLPTVWTKMDISHSGMTVIEFKEDSQGICIPKMLMLSNDSHLYREGLPTKYNNEKFI